MRRLGLSRNRYVCLPRWVEETWLTQTDQSMLNVIWTLKVCLLIFYNRLTMGLRQQMGVKVLSVYVAAGYIACQLTIFCECIPFSTYWQVAPSPSSTFQSVQPSLPTASNTHAENCMVYFDYLIIQAIFNISSDVFMMLIPLPLILTVSVPAKQKLVLVIIFSMAIFVIVASILTKAEFFLNIYADDFMFWYTREASVAVYVANLPCIWPLLREFLPVLRSWTPGYHGSTLDKRSRYNRHQQHSGGGGGSVPVSRSDMTRTRITRCSPDEIYTTFDTNSSTTKSTAGFEVSGGRRSRIRGGVGGGGDDDDVSDSGSD